MSGGGGSSGYQPQDNTSAIIQAQIAADERAEARRTEAAALQRHYDIIDEQNRIDDEKRYYQQLNNDKLAAEQRAENTRVADREATYAREDRLAANERSEAAAAQKIIDDRETARVSRANTAKTTVDASARTRAASRLNALGAPDYLDEATAEYDRILAGIPEGDPNPGSYYSADVLNSIISDAETERRRSYTRGVNTSLPSGFEYSYIPDTADDQYIDKLLTSRSGEAEKSIDYARARGQLNDAGYSGARSKYDEQLGAARGTLSSIGSSILGTKRSALTPIRDDAYSAASNYRLGDDAPDFSTYTSRARSLADSSLAGLEGDILGSLGNTSLFNINDLILAGGRAQGPQNLTTASIPSRLKKQETDRGLGTTGAF